VRDPLGGEPFALVSIERMKPAAAPAEDKPAKAAPEPLAADPVSKERMTAAEMEVQSGVKVVRGGGEAPESVVIQVPQPNEIRLAPAPDKRLVERSRHGVLPRIGSDGARPADVYARPVPPFPGGKVAGRIAIVVGGLGLSQTTTTDALARLPGAVTLAFAPYGVEIEKQVARAREKGHEVMLQVPMEPFDYPDNDPGPHTLVATGQPAETMDRLHWVMSRFPGYVGIVNYMGGKFTSSEAALTPVLRELAGRGVVYLDDGTSARSLVATVASTVRLPVARADAVIDATPKASLIDEQLARLESLARSKGLAIGSASSLPITIDRLAAWAKALEAKGIQLVPVSAAIAKPGRG
jgi:polysaccharide deacetylase 2 family uncharacterized protein YibQ